MPPVELLPLLRQAQLHGAQLQVLEPRLAPAPVALGLVVATTEPTSITDAYALMKVMSQEYGTRHFKLVVNMVEKEADAKRVYASLSNALDKFLKNVTKISLNKIIISIHKGKNSLSIV